MTDAQREAIDAILDVYTRIAGGVTRGAGGVFLADGLGTLTAITLQIELIEALASSIDRTVFGRTAKDRRMLTHELF